jgi:hypothetical protein
MKPKLKLHAPAMLVLAAALTATPVLAQGKAKGHGKHKDRTEVVQQKSSTGRPELQRRERYDGRNDRRWDDRDRSQTRKRKSVPPGWCIGKGNPHNTPENCGPRRDRRDDDRVYGDRDRDRRDDDRRYRSYEEAHDRFHRDHKRQCDRRLAERPLDPVWQLRVRAECRAEHDRWHDRYDPNRRSRD